MVLPENRASEDTRDKKGRFMKGRTGNPGGVSAQSLALRKALEKNGAEVASVVIEAAKRGDMTAYRLILDRVFPVSRATLPPVAFTLDDCDLPAAARSILRAAAAGELAADQAKCLLDSLGSVARIIEVQELTRDVEALRLRVEAINGHC